MKEKLRVSPGKDHVLSDPEVSLCHLRMHNQLQLCRWIHMLLLGNEEILSYFYWRRLHSEWIQFVYNPELDFCTDRVVTSVH